MLEHVEQLRPELAATGEKLTVLDLCSGFGYLAMFLSELLPPALIDSIVLLDKAWPMHSQRVSGPTSGQINPAHIWLEGWPIRLTTSKNNLKTPSGRRCIQRKIFAPAPGPVAIL